MRPATNDACAYVHLVRAFCLEMLSTASTASNCNSQQSPRYLLVITVSEPNSRRYNRYAPRIEEVAGIGNISPDWVELLGGRPDGGWRR